MLDSFKGITEKEYLDLQDGVVEIAILIAGADGSIDKRESEWAEKVTRIRSFTLPDGLRQFYVDRKVDFKDQLEKLIEEYPTDIEERQSKLIQKLGKLNSVFPKIENRRIAFDLYESFLSFAEHVAKSHGGVLGWGRIGPDEEKLIKLSMLEPVQEPDFS